MVNCDSKDYCKAFQLVQKQKQMGSTDEMIENDKCEICGDYPVESVDENDS